MGGKIYTGMDAFNEGMEKSQNIFNSLVNNRVNAAKAAEQEAKNPYVGNTMLADLINKQNVNKYYGQNIESEIGLRGAQSNNANSEAANNRQLHDNPGLRGTDFTKELELLKMMNAGNDNTVQQQQPPPLPVNAGNDNMPAQQNGNDKVIMAYQPPINGNPVPNGNPMSRANVMAQGNVDYNAQKAAMGTQQPVTPQQSAQFNPQTELQKHIQSLTEKNNNMYGRNVASVQKQRQLEQNIQTENPEFTPDQTAAAAGRLLDGKDTLTDEITPINVGGLTRQAVINANGTAATSQIKNQFIRQDELVDSLDRFNIDSIAKFAGPEGKARLIKAQAMMAANPDDPRIDPAARDYFTNTRLAIANMDKMRQAWGTSIVPDYVYNTVGRLANPNDSIWNDATQVKKTFELVKKNAERSRDIFKAKVRGGALAELPKETGTTSMTGTNASTEGGTTKPTVRWVRHQDGTMTSESS